MGRFTQKRRHEIDWGEVRRRLLVAAARGSDRMDDEAERAILDERARKLARPLATAADAGLLLELLTFELSGESYAVDASCVVQVLKLQDLSRLPGAPDHLLGLTNLRGDILPVFDLRALLEISRAQLNDLSRLLVMGAGEPEFGLLADAVHEIVRRKPSELLPPAAGLGREGLPYLRGVTADALIVLDGPALLHDPRLFLNVVGPEVENDEP